MSTRSGSADAPFWGDADDETALSRYRALVNTIDDGIYQLDAEGNFVAVNDEIVETTGYDRDDLVGEHVSLLLADGDVERIEREIATQFHAGGEVTPFELSVQTADGDAIPCELRISTLVDDGEFQGTIGVARNVSERQERLETLESAKASYDSVSTVLDEAGIGVFVLDDEFEIAWADETVEQYFDLDRDAILGRDKRAVIEESIDCVVDGARDFSKLLTEAYDDNSYVEQFECQVAGADGDDERWLEHYSRPIESGQYAGGRIELYYDVTDRKESEDARQETEAQFQSLVDAVEEYAIFRLDPEGHVTSWNEGAKEIKGYETEEILGEHFSAFYTDSDRAAGVPEQNLEQATVDGSVEDEGWRVRKDGTQFWANVTITEVRDDEGRHRGYLKVTRDMTDRRERERELETELQTILGRVSDAFYAVDDEFRFTHVNERAEELLDRPEDELLDEHLWDVLPVAGELEDVRGAFEDARTSNQATSVEYYDEPLGFWVEANLYPSETGISVYFRDVTERKQREQTLERYETIVETVDDGIYAVDPDSRFVLVNEALCELTGYDREQLLGRRANLVHDEEITPRAERLAAEVAAGERDVAKIDLDLETRSGERVPVESRVAPFSVGEEYGRCGVVRDVSERVERERELARFKRAVEASGHAIYMTDVDGTITYVNSAFEETTGYAADEVVGGTPSILQSSEHDENYYRTLWETVRAGEVWEEEITDRRKDGSLYHAEQTIAPVTDDDGEIDRYVAVQNDITERKERERELEESERRYRTLVDHFPNGAVGLFDEDLTYTIVGGQLLETLGHDPEEIVGTTIYDRYPDDLVEEIEPDFEAVFEDESNTFEIDLGERILLAQTLPVRNAADDIYAGMVMVQDITERRAYRERLETSNERLEQFAYSASHDLQEPLRMVTSYLQLLENRHGDDLADDAEEFLEFAVDGAERMHDMIEALLEYSRVETRGDPFEPVDLDDVLADVREDLQIRIEESDAEITGDDLPTVQGDAHQLRQVFQNLLGNAIEYSGDEPPEIEVTAERVGVRPNATRPGSDDRHESDGGAWRIAVRDRGIGIDPDETDRIFEVFERLHTREEHPGTGIGLALCQRIVERHGGRIRVDSEPGEGATFSFRLPATEE